MTKRKTVPPCPECGAPEPRPILYGLPMEEGRLAIERGEVAAGGCCLTGDDPTHECRECGHRYNAEPKPLFLSDRFSDALFYAATIHGGQMRKGTGIPYISHLMSVAAIVLEYGGDEDEAIAGLLHDAVEDQGGAARLDDIRNQYGDRVGDIVAACSDSFTENPERKPPWRKRKAAYHQHLRSVADASVLLVSAADKLHNARATAADVRQLGPIVWERFTGGRSWALWNYRELIKAYRDTAHASRVTALVYELEICVKQLESGG